MRNKSDTGLPVAKELNAAVRRLNARARHANQKCFPFLLKTRSSNETGRRIIYLDLLVSMPPPCMSQTLEAERCEAWLELISVAAEVNRLIDKARRQNAEVVLRIVECDRDPSKLTASPIVSSEMRRLKQVAGANGTGAVREMLCVYGPVARPPRRPVSGSRRGKNRTSGHF